MEHYSAFKKKKTAIYNNTDDPEEHDVKWNKPHTAK